MTEVPKRRMLKSIFENENNIDWLQFIVFNKKVPRTKELNVLYSKVIAKEMHFTQHLNWIVDQLIEDTNKDDEPCF
jgi:hypothetical protein